MFGSFPNSHIYSKRMAEHMLILNNVKNIPLVLLRPSAFGTAAYEPMPGWSDSINLVLGASLAVGLGVLRDMRGNGKLIADLVPVDFVVRQLLVTIPYLINQVSAGGPSILISHCTTSVLNPCTWNNFFAGVTKY